jgi:chromate transporter
VLVGAPHFARLQQSARIQAFLTGAGACAIGAIAGVCIPLGLALAHLWQVAPALLAAGWLLALRKSVVIALIGCGAIGVVAVLAGAPA